MRLLSLLSFALSLFVIGSCSQSQENKKSVQTRERDATDTIIEEFFKIYPKSPEEALKHFFSPSPWVKEDNLRGIIDSLTRIGMVAGKYNGYELLNQSYAGESFVMKSYMVKYDRQPIRFSFAFYKPSTKWIPYYFKMDDRIREELENANGLLYLKATYED
jgi:hypothetical protein